MIEITGRVLKTTERTLTNGSKLSVHHVLANGGDVPQIYQVQDWENRKLPMEKSVRVPVSIVAWKSKRGSVGVQYTLVDGLEVK